MMLSAIAILTNDISQVRVRVLLYLRSTVDARPMHTRLP
jgi:hypothetical protein